MSPYFLLNESLVRVSFLHALLLNNHIGYKLKKMVNSAIYFNLL